MKIELFIDFVFLIDAIMNFRYAYINNKLELVNNPKVILLIFRKLAKLT